MRHTITFVSVVLAVGLFLAAFSHSGGCSSPARSQPMIAVRSHPLIEALTVDSSSARQTRLSIVQIAERCKAAVVSITASRFAWQTDDQAERQGSERHLERLLGPGARRFGDLHYRRMEQRQGSGVIVEASGIVMTASHLVSGASTVRVTLADGSEIDADVIGSDPGSDIAALRLQGSVKGLKALTFGRSAALRSGQVILAMGHPFGVGPSVSMGIVSATGVTDLGLLDFEDFIQTDATINPGSSGGALVNLEGELVGINTAIASSTSGHHGIGFAIPTDMARPIFKRLLKDGRVRRGWLGVAIQDLTPELALALELQGRQGVVVSEVIANTPAASAGIQRDDLIQAIDDQPVRTVGQLRNRVGAFDAGATVRVKLVRSGRPLTQSLALALAEAEPSPTVVRAEAAKAEPSEPPDAGIEVEVVSGGNSQRQLVVTHVAPWSPAHAAGIEEEDTIVEVDRVAVATVKQLQLALESGRPALLLVRRDGRTSYVVLPARTTRQ